MMIIDVVNFLSNILIYVSPCTSISRDAHQDLAKIGDLDSSSDRIK